MCFSATVSFGASGLIGATGVLTLREVRSKNELPLASVPLLFAIQQFVEGVIWISFGKAALLSVMAYAYSFFSHLLWPILLPAAMLLVEPDKARRKIMKVFVYLGILVFFFDLYAIVRAPPNSPDNRWEY